MKTAGTSLAKELHRIYKNKYYLDPTFREDRSTIGIFQINKSTNIYPKINFDNYKVLHGHITYDKYKHLNWPVFTFLKDPVERVIDHYSSATNFARLNGRKQVSVLDFCRKSSNLMTNMTGGDLDNFFFVGIVEQYQESIKRLSEFIGHDIKFRKYNMTKTLLPFNKKQLSIVRKYNEDDIKLYEEALKRFK
jgi:hypothetical protein